jgi:hypothetical protein
LHERKQVKRREAESAMLSRMERIECKLQMLEHLDPKHEVMLEGTFVAHLAATIRAEDPKERRQEIGEALEAYEGALDGALYEIFG